MGRIAPELSGKPGESGCRGRDNRLFVEAVLGLARTGLAMARSAGSVGKWFHCIYALLALGGQKGVWERIFKALRDDPDFESVLIDGTLVRSTSMAPAQKGDSKIRP